MTTLADVQSKLVEAAAAQETGDYDTALTKARSARLLLAGLPRRIQQGTSSTELTTEFLDGLISDLERAQVRAQMASGPQVTKVTWGRPTG